MVNRSRPTLINLPEEFQYSVRFLLKIIASVCNSFDRNKVLGKLCCKILVETEDVESDVLR